MVLNRVHQEELIYKFQEPHWHECKTKVNNSWRTFVLKFNRSKTQDLEELNKKLKNILTSLQTDKHILYSKFIIPFSFLYIAVSYDLEFGSDII